MDRNIGAPNRRIPPDVHPKGSTSGDLERREDYAQAPIEGDENPESPDASIADYD